MVNLKIVDAAEVKRRPKTAPVTRMIAALPDDLMTARQVAEYFGVNIETIRRLARAKDGEGNDKFKAPSKAAQQGELVLWAYTQEDLAELTEYFGDRRPQNRKEKK